MLSVKSLFNWTLYRKNMTRFWPIWGVYALIWIFMMPVALLSKRNTNSPPELRNFSSDVITMYAQEAMLIMTVGLAIVAAMAVFSYLFNNRSAGFIHALPMRREGLFLTNYLSGLSFAVLPAVLVAGLTLLTEAALGCVNVAVLGQWLLTQVLMMLFFFSFSVLLAMFTGHVLALPAFYAIFNYLAAGVFTLLSGTLSTFLFGYIQPRGAQEFISWLTPLDAISRHMGGGDHQWANIWPTLFGYAAVGLVMAGLALLLYRKKQIECAGDIIAVSFARPVFKYGVALCSALTLGQLFYAIFSNGIIPRGGASLLVCTALGGFLGYFIAEMLLRKSFKVFRAWKGAAAVVAVVFLCGAGLALDLFGYARHLPTVAEVAEVRVSQLYTYPSDEASSGPIVTSDPAVLQLTLDLHSAILAERNSDLGVRYDEASGSTGVEIEYMLKGGGTLRRKYDVMVTQGLLLAASSAAHKLNLLVNDRTVVAAAYGLGQPEGARLLDIAATVYEKTMNETGSNSTTLLSVPDTESLAAAVQEDMAAGRLGRRYLLDDGPRLENCYYNDLVFTYQMPTTKGSDLVEQGNRPRPAKEETRTRSVTLQTTATSTLAELERQGLLEELNLITMRDVYS